MIDLFADAVLFDDNVILEPLPHQETTASGLTIPRGPQEPREARVVAAGPWTTLAPHDRVLFEANAGTPFSDGGRQLLFARSRHVLGVVAEN